MRARQPRCKIGALRHAAEVARVAPVHHDCAMGGRPRHSARKLRRVRWSKKRWRRRCSWYRILQESKLAVASKSVVIATTPQIAKQVVSSLARHDIHIQEAGQARDLGLDVSSARKSARRTMAKRWAKAGKRTKRCARFGRWASKQATARLWRTGAWAQKAYGTAAMGAPPSWVKQARTRAAEAAQCGGRGRCLTTAIALLHPNADPAVQVPCNLIRQWLIFWEHNHRLRPYIGKVWAKIATAMMARSPATRWRYVRGHMSAVIVTLMQHNWVPIRHTSWKDPEGNRWTLKAGGVGIDDWGFWQAFRASIEGQLWEKAARHELGAGLDGGADLTTLFKHDKFLERKGLHTARGMLLAAATASCWTQERRYRAGRTQRSARDARKPMRTCFIGFGNAEPTQVRSLTGHSISFRKPPKPKTHLNASGSGGLYHDPGLCKTRSWVSGANLGVAY